MKTVSYLVLIIMHEMYERRPVEFFAMLLAASVAISFVVILGVFLMFNLLLSIS